MPPFLAGWADGGDAQLAIPGLMVNRIDGVIRILAQR